MVASRASNDRDNIYKTSDDVAVFIERCSPWNVGRIRIIGVFVHFKYFVLLLAELAVITCAIYFCYLQAAVQHPQSSGWLVLKSLFAAGPLSLCFAGLGLYSS